MPFVESLVRDEGANTPPAPGSCSLAALPLGYIYMPIR